jgi:hypothetical protein
LDRRGDGEYGGFEIMVDGMSRWGLWFWVRMEAFEIYEIHQKDSRIGNV